MFSIPFLSFCPIPAINSEFLFVTGALWACLVKLHYIFSICLYLVPLLALTVIPTMEISKASSALKIEPCERWISERWCARSLVVWVGIFIITLVILRACSAKSTEVWKEIKLSRGFVGCDLIIPFLQCRLWVPAALEVTLGSALLSDASSSPCAPSQACSLLAVPGAAPWMRGVRFLSLGCLWVQVAQDPSLSSSSP